MDSRVLNLDQVQGTFVLHQPQRKKSFVISILTPNGNENIGDIIEKAKEVLPSDSKVKVIGNKIYFTNKSWEFDERKRKEKPMIEKDLLIQKPSENGNGKAKDETSTEENKGHPATSEIFNTELIRLNAFGNRLETLMDELVLRKLSLKETLGQIYDNMKQNNVEFYSTDVQIQIVEKQFVIPHLTREAFIEIGLKSLKKEKV